MDKWKEIWNKEAKVHDYVLETLIKADGFDSGAGSFALEDWKRYTDEHFAKLAIEECSSIYDIGCGSGAFIYPLYLQKYDVGGIDYASVLIDLANTVMRNGAFEIKEAIAIDTDKKYDAVVSHSVFHYFRDLEYAKRVVEKMIQKATRKIAIFDINDQTKESRYHAIRMGAMDQDAYRKKYAGLEHLFYDKEWFGQIAEENGVEIEIFDQTFSHYSNASLRFNVIMEKR